MSKSTLLIQKKMKVESPGVMVQISDSWIPVCDSKVPTVDGQTIH